MKTCPQCQATHPDGYALCPNDGAALAEPDVWTAGTEIEGRYRILARIGRDVVFTVYKAVHTKSNQFRALKVMSAELAKDPAFVKLFEEDAVLRKKLKHPNVSQVAEIGESEDGHPYIVMEYVAGQSLKKFIEQDAPFHPLRVCAIAKQVAAGLEAAHALGLVHRDVKPDTIYVLDGFEPERIKLLGLGISKLQEALLGDQFRTAPEAIIGTFQYLSPEQALGQLGSEIDGRADLYSLGVVMYEMLTKALPFQANTAADWMMAHIQGTPIPIRVAHAELGIPDPLTNLVTECLNKNRESRPASARQFIREVELVEAEMARAEQAKRAPPKPRIHHKSSGWKFWKG